MFVVDTNVVSEVRKAERCVPAVKAWFQLQPREHLFLSVTTIQELYFGAYLKQRKDADAGRELLYWIEKRVIPQFDENILPIDVETARINAELHVPTTRPQRDALIAATALRHDMAVATRNVSDFSPMGVRVFNPWDYAP
jgi:toxin FitB